MYSSAAEVLRLAAATVVLVLPGAPLALCLGDARRDPVAAASYAGLLGLGCQIAGFWWLRWVPIGLAGLAAALGVLGVAGLVVVWRRRLRPDWSGVSRTTWVLLAAVLAIVVGLRLLPFALAAVPPGQDMSMHATIARLIAAADGVPTSYRPLEPVDSFGGYGVGLPAIAAIASAIAAVPVWRSAFFFACLTHVLLALAVYSLARRRTDPAGALLVMLVVSVATRDPQLHFFWGGEPSVLSLALLVAAFPLLDDLADGGRWRVVPPLATLLAAAALTHAVLPYAFAYAWTAAAAARAVVAGPRGSRRSLPAGLAAAGLAALLALPYALGWSAPLSAGELEVVRQWQHLPVHLPPGRGLGLVPGLAVYVVRRLGPLLPAWVAVALVARRWGGVRGGLTGEAAFSAATLLLVLNALAWLLPASYVLYPDRVVTLLVIPATLVIAGGVEAATRAAGERPARLLPRVAAAALALVLGVSLPLAAWYWYLQGLRYVAVSRNDLDVIRWIAANTPPDALIATEYGDAGAWIPAIAGRAVTAPHVHFLYRDEFRAGMAGSRPRYVFVGAKKVAEGGDLALDRLERDTWSFRELYRRGAAAVFLARVPP